jgi:hypothetical protein
MIHDGLQVDVSQGTMPSSPMLIRIAAMHKEGFCICIFEKIKTNVKMF